MAVTFRVVTEPAERYLQDALDYLANHAAYESSKRWLRKLLDAIYSLETMPEAHGLVQEMVGLSDNEYRQLVAAKHRIMFTVEEVNIRV